MNKSTKQTITGVAILVVVAAAMTFLAIGGSKGPVQTGAVLLSNISATDNAKGNPEAKVTLVEYSDFQCPACASYHPIVEQLMTEIGTQINFVYRHFPLPQHDQAEAAAYAAEAAGKQDKFWEMYNLLFQKQTQWADKPGAEKTFESYAVTLGLDIAQYQKDFSSSEVKDKVESDRTDGLKNGLNSTPSFFLNGQQIANPRGYDEFKNLILAADNS